MDQVALLRTLNMPFIEVHCLEGRSEEQFQQLAKAITDAVAEIFKVSKDAVWIKFSEMPKNRFATGGNLVGKK
jgi:4-oxalocrotonate tautomerase family enzyme